MATGPSVYPKGPPPQIVMTGPGRIVYIVEYRKSQWRSETPLRRRIFLSYDGAIGFVRRVEKSTGVVSITEGLIIHYGNRIYGVDVPPNGTEFVWAPGGDLLSYRKPDGTLVAKDQAGDLSPVVEGPAR